jgi:hypothetical protein
MDRDRYAGDRSAVNAEAGHGSRGFDRRRAPAVLVRPRRPGARDIAVERHRDGAPRSRRAERVDPPRPHTTASSARTPRSFGELAASGVALALSAALVVLALPVLGFIPHDFDEAWLMLDARFIVRGERPFVDFAHHEMPLHLYVLALFGTMFGETPFGYRMASLTSVAASGFLVFRLVQPVAGPVPALLAQAAFLFSPLQERGLTATPEPTMVALTLLGAVLLFGGGRRWSAWASAAAFVCALLVKPTALPMVAAAAASLAWARQWRRLVDFAVAGVVAGLLGLAWVVHVSDGVFLEVLTLQLGRISTRSVGMWSIDSGFVDMRRLAGIETPRDLAVHSFRDFFRLRTDVLPIGLFALSLLALPIWLAGLARQRPALRAFALLWPVSGFLLNFAGLDFVTPRYFIPFLAFSAFLLGGWAWLALRWIPVPAVALAGGLAVVALGAGVRPALERSIDPWYWGRVAWIAEETPQVVSFSAMQFVATGTEPGCGFANPALTYGGLGEPWLVTERTRRFLWTDERIIACLEARPDTPIVIDWAFYFFTRPGSPLRRWLEGPGRGQRLFFSPEALRQWDEPLLRMSPLR